MYLLHFLLPEIIDEMLENREPVKKKKAVKTYEVAGMFYC